MDQNLDLRFERFRLDRKNQELRDQSHVIALRPKAFAVLQYLAENPSRLITQDELLKAVWGPIVVGDGLLRGYIRDLRHALGDDAENPRFIETIPRRGVRFLPRVTLDPGPAEVGASTLSTNSLPAPGLVGRDQDLDHLRRLMSFALDGRRQVVFIAGEAGIGKTALLNTFLRQMSERGAARIVCGQCVEQYGTREAYLPIFDALGRLCSGEHRSEAIAILSQYAPSWLAQMQGLLSADQLRNLQSRVAGTTQARSIGEFCEALEAYAAEQPFIVALEDLQWTDLATLDLLSIIARRETRARLMVIGTYRPADVIVAEHPLRRVLHYLQAHRQCTELWPEYLSEAQVDEYLDHRFSGHDFPQNFNQLIHRNSGGNPLFLTTIVDELEDDKQIEHRGGRWHLAAEVEKVNAWKSPSLRHLIEGQLSRFPVDEQRLLEVAAIVGSQFASDAVAAALDIDQAEVEDRCDALVRRRQVLRMNTGGSTQNASDSPQYEFVHDLYRTAAFDRSSQVRRREWFKRIAEKLAAHSGDRDDAATELAYYFEHAGMAVRAAGYCAVGGEKAMQRFARAEAFAQFRRGIDMLKSVPASRERDATELRLQVGNALTLIPRHGYRSEEVVRALSRARELNERLGDGPQDFAALRGLYELLTGQAEYESTFELCEQIDQVAQRENDRYVTAEALRLRGLAAFWLGRWRESQDALSKSIAAYNRETRASKVFAIWDDPLVSSASILIIVLWMLGYPEQARKTADDALSWATALDAPYSVVVARSFRAMLMRFLRNYGATIEEADAATVVADKHGFAIWHAQAALERGWATAMQGRTAAGIKEIRSALASMSLGPGGSMAKLAEACLQAGKPVEGLRAVDEALHFVLKHKEGAWEPELHRLKGELLLRRAQSRGIERGSNLEQAERCFSTAIQRARDNDAKSFELRAAMSLSRLWKRQGKRAEARRVVADIYGWFTEGFDSADLVEARGLLK